MIQSRQLVAIMFTDIVGYTALMGDNEQRAFELLNKNRQIQKPIIDSYNGRWIKELGDGVMASFNTISDAVNAAIKIQEACNSANDFQLRIGIHQGEVVFEDDDIFGDAVNIASRIQAVAKPGCIYVSESVYNNVANKKEIQAKFIKEESLKNLKEPVKIFEVSLMNELIVPDRNKITVVHSNSIAVLPFANMSSDPEQEFFSDGITEEIINMLAQVPGLKVVGRTSSFSFKGKNLDLRLIGEQLNVNHILEGSVRKSGNKMRITAQLINVGDGFHLWSEKYDRLQEDIFDIQDEISLAIVEKLKIHLFEDERKQVVKNKTQNLEAYQTYLMGLFQWNKRTKEGILKSIEFFEKAIAIDPDYALAYTGLADSYLMMANWGYVQPKETKIKAKEILLKSLEIDDQLADTYTSLAFINSSFEWKWQEAEDNYEKALELNPNLLKTHVWLTMHLLTLGKSEIAITHSNRSLELDPLSLVANNSNGMLLYGMRQFDEAIKRFRKTLLIDESVSIPHNILFFIFILKGLNEDAVKEYQALLFKDPITQQYAKTLGDIYTTSGIEGCLHWLLEVGFEFHKQIHWVPYYRAVCHAMLGEKDEAFIWLETVLEIRSDLIFLLFTDPGFDNLRSDRRFTSILEKTGLG